MESKSAWAQKLADSKGLPKRVRIKKEDQKRLGKGMMVIPAPKDVDRAMKSVRKGKLATVDMIRKSISKRYKTTVCCPLTTGIFVWIAANAANEAMQEGNKSCTPYWRTIRTDGTLNPRYPGGEMAHAKKLRDEGHRITRNGKKLAVLDFEQKLQKF